MLVLGLGLFIYGCNIIDPEEKVPAFVQIDSVGFFSDSIGSFTDHEITDIWAYQGATFLGVFPIPSRIPVLASGSVPILLEAGIFSDGIRTLRMIYPFYRFPIQSLELSPGQTTRVYPVFRYPVNIIERNNTLYDDFNDGLIFNLNKSGPDTAKLSFTVHSGNLLYPKGGPGCGLLTAEPGGAYVMQLTDQTERVIGFGRNVFLEFNYRMDVQLIVGVFANNNGTISRIFDLRLNPSTEWKKVYVNLTEEVNRFPGGRYRVFLEGQSNLNGGSIAIDNVRLLYLK